MDVMPGRSGSIKAVSWGHVEGELRDARLVHRQGLGIWPIQ